MIFLKHTIYIYTRRGNRAEAAAELAKSGKICNGDLLHTMPFGNLRNEMPHRQEKKTAKCKQPLFPEKKYVFESKCNWRENSDFELFKNE